MTKTTTIHTEIEPEIKAKAESIFNDLGISAAEAVNMFMKQVVLSRGLPVIVTLSSEETDVERKTKVEFLQKIFSEFDDCDEPLTDEFDEILSERFSINRELELL